MSSKKTSTYPTIFTVSELYVYCCRTPQNTPGRGTKQYSSFGRNTSKASVRSATLPANSKPPKWWQHTRLFYGYKLDFDYNYSWIRNKISVGIYDKGEIEVCLGLQQSIGVHDNHRRLFDYRVGCKANNMVSCSCIQSVLLLLLEPWAFSTLCIPVIIF